MRTVGSGSPFMGRCNVNDLLNRNRGAMHRTGPWHPATELSPQRIVLHGSRNGIEAGGKLGAAPEDVPILRRVFNRRGHSVIVRRKGIVVGPLHLHRPRLSDQGVYVQSFA